MSEQISGLGDVLQKSLDSMKELAGVQTIIGEAISAPGGTLIIPISKVSIGIASGGLDSHERGGNEKATGNPAQSKMSANKKFTGGGGSGVTVSPVGFLIVKANGDVELLNVGVNQQQTTADSVIGLIEHSPEIISRLKDVFSKFGRKSSDAEEDFEDILKTKASSEDPKPEENL